MTQVCGESELAHCHTDWEPRKNESTTLCLLVTRLSGGGGGKYCPILAIGDGNSGYRTKSRTFDSIGESYFLVSISARPYQTNLHE